MSRMHHQNVACHTIVDPKNSKNSPFQKPPPHHPISLHYFLSRRLFLINTKTTKRPTSIHTTLSSPSLHFPSPHQLHNTYFGIFVINRIPIRLSRPNPQSHFPNPSYMQYANSMPHRKHLLNNLLTHSSSSSCQPPPSSALTARHTEMPHSFLLHRLSFTILTAVDSFTNLLLSCEAHMPPSPRIPRSPRPRSPRPRSPRPIRRKNSILSAPSSPTSVNPYHSPTIPYPHPKKSPSIEEYPPPLRHSRTRHHLISSRVTPRTLHDPAIHPRLTRREILPPNVRQQSHRHTQRQEKRTRTLSRHQSYNHHRQRFAFVDPPPNTSPSMQAVNPWHRNRDSVNRVAAHKRSRHVQPDPPVAPIALPSNPRPFPRGTLTSFLTTDDTGIFDFKKLEAASSRDPLLEQGIRPSRRVRFAQKVQLVC